MNDSIFKFKSKIRKGKGFKGLQQARLTLTNRQLNVVVIATAGHVTRQPIGVLEHESVNQWLKLIEHRATGPKRLFSGDTCCIETRPCVKFQQNLCLFQFWFGSPARMRQL